MKNRIIPIFIPHKGCPFDCVFCNQRKISGQIEELNKEEIESLINSYLETLKSEDYLEVAFFGGSFTGIPIELQREYLGIAKRYLDEGCIKSIRLSTRPDYINATILEQLREFSVRTIELGVQSLDSEVLSKSNRGHTVEQVYKACEMIKKAGFDLGIQTMTGLPGDTYQKSIDTANKVIELNPRIVRIYPALVIKDTYMEKMYANKLYTPFSLEETVELCAELMDMYEGVGIKVIRVGLQSTDNINDKMDVVAGPFHPAIRQLVESRRLLHQLENKLGSLHLKENQDLIIIADRKSISDVIGQNKSNVMLLKEKYGIGRIKVIDKLENMDFYNSKDEIVTISL